MAKTNKGVKVIRPNQSKSEEKRTKWQTFRGFFSIGFIIGLISLIPTIASYTTKVSIDLEPQSDQTKPFSFPATVSNGGTFPVQLEEYILGWHELKTSKGDVLGDTVLAVSPSPVVEMYPGGKYDLIIPLDKMADASPAARLISPGATITSCDLVIGVKCKTFWFISQYQVFHFRAVVRPDGRNYWSPGPSFSSRWIYKTLRNASSHQ